jgi:hypothetical protein
MKCLLLHCRSFSYEVRDPTPAAESVMDGVSRIHGDCLVAFVSIEPGDGARVRHAAKSIRRHAARLGVRSIVVNPFVHLTSTPAPASEAQAVGHALVARLRTICQADIEYAGFGWQKSFVVDVHGGVLSHAFREFSSGGDGDRRALRAPLAVAAGA